MKISVVIPVYNVEKFLAKCLRSVIAQSYADLEIILVNDGSTDGSAEICEYFANADSRIKVIHQLNEGVSVARNTGINVATGNFVTFLDSDDWLEKDMYSGMISKLEKHPQLDMIMGDTVLVFNDHKIRKSEFIREGYYTEADIKAELYDTLLVTEDFAKIPIVSACSMMVRRNILLESKIYFEPSLKYCEDYLFIAEIMVNLRSFFYVKGLFSYNYRQYSTSRSKLLQTDWWVNLVGLNTKLKILLENSRDYDFTRQLKLQLIHSALFLTSLIFNNTQLSKNEKKEYIKNLLNSSDLQAAFADLTFNQQPFTIKIVLFLLKHKMVKAYIRYRTLIDHLKIQS